VHAVRALRPRAPRRPLARRLGRDLEALLEQAAPAWVDVGGCRGSPDLPRPRSLRRGRTRAHRPRPPLHGVADAAFVRLAGTALRELGHLCEPSAHGPAAAVEEELQDRRLPAPGPRRAAGAEGVWDAGSRQRLRLVPLGRR
jgi:hypothetical protein